MFEKLILPLFKAAFANASPDIRKFLVDSVAQLEVKAKATPNGVDDMLVIILKAVLDI